MRSILLATTLAIALLAAPGAMAHRGEVENDDDDDDDRYGAYEKRKAEKAAHKAQHKAEHEAEKEHKKATRMAFRFLMDSWHENATKTREHCRPLYDANDTKPAKQCVREGYLSWWNANWGMFVALKMANRHGYDH